MNQNTPSSNFELPPLSNEAGSESIEQNIEAPASQERTLQPPVASQPLPVQPISYAPLQPVALPLDPVSAGSASVALSADDNDLIEKEWIVKAKQIVAATKEDPHAQNRELSKIKAEYLKKRYGKDIKVDES